MHAHTARKMTVKLVILGLIADHPDAERGIGKALFYHADEFDYVLGHREKAGVNGADRSYRVIFASASGLPHKNLRFL